jgi:hypothetical protein
MYLRRDFRHKTRITCSYVLISPFVINKIRFMHKTSIRLYLCFNICLYVFQSSVRGLQNTELRVCTEGVHKARIHYLLWNDSCLCIWTFSVLSCCRAGLFILYSYLIPLYIIILPYRVDMPAGRFSAFLSFYFLNICNDFTKTYFWNYAT